MPKSWRKLFMLTALAVGVFGALSVYKDLDEIGDRLLEFNPLLVGAALLLAIGNYLIRFVRWQEYLRITGHPLPRKASALVFVSGFSMSVTPGKVGEIFKAAMLRELTRSTMARTVPIVIAERATDLASLVLLGLLGVALYGVGRAMVVAGGVAVLFGMVVMSYRPLAYGAFRLARGMGVPRGIITRVQELYDNLAHLLRPAPLAWGTSLGGLAWLCECVGFALIIWGYPGASVNFGMAMLIYAATTIAGALSFLPGGLLVTEASMVVLLVRKAQGLDKAAAVAATLIVRLCTLWFAVVIGFLALALFRKLYPEAASHAAHVPGSERTPSPDQPSEPPSPPSTM